MKNKFNFKKLLPHIVAIISFLVLPAIYFSPMFEGKVLQQGDMMKFEGAAKEQKDYFEKTGEKTSWTSSMFSGMPSYQIYGRLPSSLIYPIAKAVCLGDTFQLNMGIIFLYLLAAYIALILLGCNPWISLFGAISVGFASYNIIIIEAGHITKAWAISMVIPILTGMMLCFKKKYLSGGLLFLFAIALQIAFNHIQITYYTLIIAVILGLVYLIYAIKEKQFKSFFIGFSILVVGAIMGFLLNAGHLLTNQEYAKYTMRGGSEITVTPNDLQKDATRISTIEESTKSGLEIDYAFQWSYGVGETFTVLVPGLYGGSNNERVSKDSEFYKNFHQQRAPLYWGDQPFTSGPVYFGAIICFLFVLGLFVVKGREKWWILAGIIICILMSWGKNFMGFNQFLFENLPLYNKFRTPSMSLVGANALMIMMSVLALKAIFDKQIQKKQLNNAIYYSAGIVGGICLIILLFKNALFSFTGHSDLGYQQSWEPAQFNMFLDILVADRKALVTGDTLRSLVFIILSAGLLWTFANEKIKKQGIVLGLLCALTLIDFWGIDKRYLNESNFARKQQATLQPTQNDLLIKQSAQHFGDKVYRVYNVAGNPFNDSYTSAFHHSIGGYHAAKLRRYQDIIDFYLSKGNMSVINMLNTRYFIISDGRGGATVQRNSEALGNAWFVHDFKLVENPNAEILALNDFDPSQTAIIDTRFQDKLHSYMNGFDSIASIQLIADELYNPEKLTYKTKTSRDQLAVFSEIYYEPDWQVFIDGKPAEYFRVNYILRAMIVPAGEHTIEFKLEPKTFNMGSNLSLVTSIVLVLMIGGIIFYEYKRKKSKIS